MCIRNILLEANFISFYAAITRLILVGCFVVGNAELLQAKMYIWKDAEGNQHVTDSPPPNNAVLEKSVGSNVARPRSSVESYIPGQSPSAEIQRAYQNLSKCGPYRKLQMISSGQGGPPDVTTTEFESSKRIRIIERKNTRSRQGQSTSSNESGLYDGYIYRQKKNGHFVRAKISGNDMESLGFMVSAASMLTGVQPTTGATFIGKESKKGYHCAVYVFDTPVNMLKMTVKTKLWVRLDEALPLCEEIRSFSDITTDYEYPESLKIPPPPSRTEEVPFTEYLRFQ